MKNVISNPFATMRFARSGERMRAPGDLSAKSAQHYGLEIEHSVVSSARVQWHVQTVGTGPVMLLLHGTGSSCHTWERLLPELARHFSLLAVDLPGHAKSKSLLNNGITMLNIAVELADMLRKIAIEPTYVVGHSAGAAVALRMGIDGYIKPQVIFSINGALLPFAGLPGKVFAPLAKLLTRGSIVPELFAWRAKRRGVIERLIESTGSSLDQSGIAAYRQLASDVQHVNAALDMMANWDLHTLARDLNGYKGEVELITAAKDGLIPVAQADEVAAKLAQANVRHLPRFGHLVHEEAPNEIAEIILRKTKFENTGMSEQ